MTTTQTTKSVSGVISPVDITTSGSHKNGQDISPNSMFIQRDGKILVTGSCDIGMILIRFNADGSFDQSFNKNGVVIDNFYTNDVHSVIAQDNGKITVIGGSGTGRVQLSRYNQDGSVDTSFDNDGRVEMGSDIYVESGIVQDDGKIVVVAHSSSKEPTIMRYNSNGSLDTSFDDDGKIETNNGYSVAVQSDGKILVGSRSNSNYLLMRYNENGSLDTSFDGDGKVEYYSANSGYILSIAVQSNGKIIATGGDQYYGNGTLFRYNSDGSLDTSFSKSGLVGLASVGRDVKIQGDGKILVVIGGFTTMRYNTDGTLDTSFDGDGKVETDINGDWDYAKSIAIQDNGKILVTGSTGYWPSFMAIVRYNSNGSIDNSFKNDSSIVADPSVVNEYPPSGVLGIYGTAEKDQALYVLNDFGDKNGIPGKINYQWFRSGVAIAGETGGFYVLTAADVNHAISVKASYVDGNNHAESITSSATAVVKPSADAELLEPSYKLTVDKASVNEGDTVTFNLKTENVDADTEIPFKFGGTISNTDVLGGLKTSSFVVDANGKASLTVKFIADKLTEGTENLTITLNSGENQSVSVKDTSLTPAPVVKPVVVAPVVVKPVIETPTGSKGYDKKAVILSGDKLIGGEKNDTLTGNVGKDELLGKAGNDKLIGLGGNDTLVGENGNDDLSGGEGLDSLSGGSGNDLLDGGNGNDTLIGDQGNDTLKGGFGVDSMDGGDGDDYYFVDNQKDVVNETNKNTLGGNDTIASTSSYTLGKNIENLVLDSIDNNNGKGNELNNQITGNIGDNKLEGMAGNDKLIGGDGADTLDGGKGKDTLIGGNDDDIYIINNDFDMVTEQKNGGEQDQIWASVDYDLGQTLFVEVLTLSGKAITGVGDDANNLLMEIENGKVANHFLGYGGDDTILSEGGNDTIEGGAGNDNIDGGDGIADTAIFYSKKENYQITRNPDAEGVDQIIVRYVGNGENGEVDEGTDTLTNIELLQFADYDFNNPIHTDTIQITGLSA